MKARILRKFFLAVSLALSTLFLIRWNSPYFLINNVFHNVLGQASLLMFFFPFAWIFYIDRKNIRSVLIIVYGLFFMGVFPIAWLGTMMVYGDLENGWRLVHTISFNQESFLGIYRTPDQGALGGDKLAAALVTPVIPGFVKRRVVFFDLISAFPGDRDLPIEIQVDGKFFSVPSPNELFKD